MRATNNEAALQLASGSWFEVLCGVLGFAAAVAGIAGIHPLFMGATATVLLGLGVFAQAGTIAVRTNRCSERDELLGISADVLGSLVGITIGGLVILHIVSFTWLPIATMALGCGLMFTARVDLVGETQRGAWSHVLMLAAGLAAMTLALIAFVAIIPSATTALVALACVGGGLAFAGGGNLRRSEVSA